MKKNILIVAGVFPPEPIVSARLMYDLAIELSKTYNVTVLRPFPSRPFGFVYDKYDNSDFPFKVIELDSYINPQSSLIGRLRESISMGKKAASYINQHHNEIDFIYNDPWQLFGVNIVARAANKYGIPYIMAVQDIYPESLSSKLPTPISKIINKLLLPIDKYNQKNAYKIHTISDKMVKTLSSSRHIPNSKYLSIRNWQNEEEFINYSDSKKNQNDIFTFMYLGNIGPLAGLEYIIDAFQNASLNNARLVIAGSGSARDSLIKIVRQKNIKNIEFWDVPNGKVPEVQEQADVMILPIKKGFSLTSIPSKLPAYMFSSKPILASVDKESDTAFCIQSSNCGWIAEAENIYSISSKMTEIINSDIESLKQMGKNGFHFALNNLSKKNNLPILVNTIKNLLK